MTSMNRRAFPSGSLLALAAPFGVEAQHKAGKISRIGLLQPGVRPPAWVDAIRQGLRDLGYVESQNIIIEHRIADGAAEQREVIAEFVRLKVDVIVSWGTGALTAQRETRAIPIRR